MGGGMAVASGRVTLDNDTFSGNIALGGSGGNGGTGSTFYSGGTGGTGGSGLGGGLYVGGGTATLHNDTFSGNNAQGGSGGQGGPGSTGGSGGTGGSGMGGGLDSAGGTTTLANTLIAQNIVTAGIGGSGGYGGLVYGGYGSAGSASAPDVLGTVASSDHDLIGDGTGFNATTSTGDLIGTSSSPINPLLGSLADNGGLTPTLALLPGSPAIDAGDSNAPGLPSTDQRGYARIAGNAVDIGAYEAQGFLLSLTSGNNQTTHINTAFANPLVVTVTAKDGVDPVAGGQLTFTTPNSGASASLSPGNPVTIASNGTATVNASANGTLGSYQVTADSTGVATAATFTLTNQTTPAVSVADASGPYTGNPFQATGTAVGIDGHTPVLGSFRYDYYDNTTGTDLGSTAPTNAGNYTVTATFTSGDSGYSSGGTAQTPFTISPAATTTSNVSLSSSTAVYGQPVTLTATITNTQTAVIPSGTIGFYNGATELGTATVGANGVATLTLSTLSVGSYSLTASFSDPASNFTSSGSRSAASLTIGKASTTTTLTATTNTTVYGQAVTFTATVAAVSPSVATPTGTVTFKDGSTVLGTVSLSNGSASLTTTHLAVGNHSITVTYNASANFKTSSSTAYPVTVSQDGTTAVVTSSVPNPVYGQSVTLKATVRASAPGSGTPTGTVTFYHGATVLGTATLSNGVATLNTKALSVGSNSITVVYGGNSNFLGTTSPALVLTVNPDSTTTRLTASSTTAAHGTQVTFTARVLPMAPGSGTPTGTVSFWVGSALLGTVNLSNGTAQLMYVFTLPGTYRIKAVYNGDSDFLSSTSSVLTETIT
jgi:hypothetical protein